MAKVNNTTNKFEEMVINNWIETTQQAYNASDLQVYCDNNSIIVEDPKSSSMETYDFTIKDIESIEYDYHLTPSDSFEGNHYVTVEKVKSGLVYDIENSINRNGYDFVQTWLDTYDGDTGLVDTDYLYNTGDICYSLLSDLMDRQQVLGNLNLLAYRYIVLTIYAKDTFVTDDLSDVLEHTTGETLDDLLEDNEFYAMLDRFDLL